MSVIQDMDVTHYYDAIGNFPFGSVLNENPLLLFHWNLKEVMVMFLY